MLLTPHPFALSLSKDISRYDFKPFMLRQAQHERLKSTVLGKVILLWKRAFSLNLTHYE